MGQEECQADDIFCTSGAIKCKFLVMFSKRLHCILFILGTLSFTTGLRKGPK